MKKGFKPASIVFYILMFVVFFFIGIYIAGFVGAGKNQMLAGGAIVVGWGVMFAAIAFLASFFIVYYLQHKSIVRLNWILFVSLLILYGITHYRYIKRQKDKEKIEQAPIKHTKPISERATAVRYYKTANKVSPVDIKSETIQTTDSEMGIGFFSPNYFEYPTFYFYGNVNLEKGLTDHAPVDSIVFTKDQHNNPTTSYAPPWLYPEHLKLDYGIIIFKVLGLSLDFAKVEVNKQNKQVAYIDKNKGKLITWPQFLLSINSVEFNENSLGKVFVKPLDYAGEVNVGFDFMQPLLVEEDWMYVRLVNDNLTEQGKGWIRWKKDNTLLIAYSLLS